MAAWLVPAVETTHIWVIIILTYMIGIGGFSHIIAGATEVFYGVFDGSRSADASVAKYMVPTLIGNITGGVALVASLNYAQVAAGDSNR